MSETLQKLQIFSKISENLKECLKSFHVFDQNKKYNALLITSDDKVLGFGPNDFGCCGLGHNSVVNEPQLIPELCHKRIKEFFVGKDFIIAINDCNQIFGWGKSDKGQLGVILENQFSKPFIIYEFGNNELAHISCGSSHCLALRSDGIVFVWGSNAQGQLGLGRKFKDKISTPTQLNALANIKSIECLGNRSYSLTSNDMVYSWGENTGYVLGLDENQCVFEPTLVNISNVVSVCVSKTNSYFLNKEGLIYYCGKNNSRKSFEKLPRLLECETKFTSLHTIPYSHKRGVIPIAMSAESVNLLYQDTIENKYCRLLSQFTDKYKVTHKTIHLSDNTLKETKIATVLNDPLKFEDRYGDKFEERSEIGKGGFGRVYKVLYKTDSRLYAVKKIRIEEENDCQMREVKALMKCKSDYVVEYIDWWPQDGFIYIQMELCSDNLESIIDQKSKCFARTQSDAMNSVEYFISCQLFKELLECVQYLHSEDIIHRDLKPANILITEQPVNGKFLKLCDFGLAKIIDINTTTTHTRGQGTPKYMAPEMWETKDEKTRYNTKADIFSLGKIVGDLFDFGINSSFESITGNEHLKLKGKMLRNIVRQMLDSEYNERPSSTQLLTDTKNWDIDNIELKNTINYQKNIQMLKDFKNKFFLQYFCAKN